MKITIASLVAILVSVVPGVFAAEPPQDLRAELPRDVRIVLLGVPSVATARAAEANLRSALDGLEADLGQESASQAKIDQGRMRVFFRVGQLDESLRSLARSLHDQERIKGLEGYREAARQLELHGEALAELSGSSDAPLVQEDEDAVPVTAVGSAADLVSQLSTELRAIDELLTRIEQQAKPDEERKAQLEREMGAIGQFVFQIKNLAADLRAAEAGEREVHVDTGEIVRGVQGLIDVIRARKRERELQSGPEEVPSSDPRPTRRVRIRL